MNEQHIKIPDTEYPIADFIKRRWSPRAFSSESLKEKDLLTLFEAASWAASSMNEQPWRYRYALKQNEGDFQSFLSCLVDGNAKWAKNAAALVLSYAQKKFDYKDRDNRHYMHDTGAANTQLVLQAADLDIYAHMMGGFHMDKTRELFSLSEDEEPVCFMALGKLGDPEQLEEKLRKGENSARERKPLNSFVKKGV